MPGTGCAVAVCKNRRDKTQHVQYHRFPKDNEIRSEWVQRCKRQDKFNPNTSYVCSDHFIVDDYERDLKAELLQIESKKILKKSAIPSRCLLPNKPIQEVNSVDSKAAERNLRYCARQNKKIASILVGEPETEERHVGECNSFTISSDNEGNTEDFLKKENESLKEKIMNLEKRILSDSKNLKKIRKENQNLKRKQLKNAKQSKKYAEVLSSVFTKNQINLLLGMKRKVKWTNEEISLAFTLRYLSKRCYLFLKNKMKIPLPGISTLQRWASSFGMRAGLLDNMFQYLKVAGSKLSNKERVTILEFDEMKVKKTLEYDVKNDEIVGPFSYMQVVMARGLFSKWKQPVYVNFDTRMTKDILESIIKNLNDVGYMVKAIVSDLGGGNVGLWKELNVNTEHTFFIHPSVTSENIYVFADVPHLLKLVRNWFLDTGFVLPGNIQINKEPVEALINAEKKSDLKICHKLTDAHLLVEKTRRQNVKKASELLSRTTATALKTKLPGKDKCTAKATGDFILLCDQWFDLMNSYIPRNLGDPSCKAYGQDLSAQDAIFQNMIDTMYTLRCCGRSGVQLFQKGIIVSIKSLQQLYIDLKCTLQISYILTHRLNQDILENLFSQIRTRGGLNDHPSPLDALYRLRMIILGKNQGVLQANTNTAALDDSEFVASKVLKISGVLNSTGDCVSETLSTAMFTEESKTEEHIVATDNICAQSDFKFSNDLEDSAFEYLCGWVARKHKQQFPYLEDIDINVNSVTEVKPSNSSWVQHLSYGGLCKPSLIWLNQAKQLEKEFQVHHGKNLVKGPGVVKNLVDKLVLVNNSTSRKIIHSYILQRTFIRMKILVDGILKPAKRQSASADEGRKTCKKYKKIIS